MNPEYLLRLILANLRPPATWSADDATGTATYTFVPPLTTAEQATLADLLTMARFGLTADLTLAEFQAIKGNLADLRNGSALVTAITAFRTRTLTQWQALTATQREADEIAYLNDLTDAISDLRAVVAALLRS